MESALLARGFHYGSAPGAVVIGWNSGHAAVTLPDGTPVSSGESGAGVRVGGGGAYQPQFSHHMYLPVFAQRMDEPAEAAPAPDAAPAPEAEPAPPADPPVDIAGPAPEEAPPADTLPAPEAAPPADALAPADSAVIELTAAVPPVDAVPGQLDAPVLLPGDPAPDQPA